MKNLIRFRLFIAFFCFILLCLVLRISYMQLIQRSFYLEKSENQLVKSIKIYPHRGRIYDRKMRPLAISKTSYAVYGFPKQLSPQDKKIFIKTAAPLLDIPSETLTKKLFGNSNFVWIGRKISPESYKTLNNLKLKGIEFFKEDERFYPNGRLAAHILGYVGIDNQGLGGLEYLYDSFLKGSSGKIMIEGDPRGKRVISGFKKTIEDAYDGGHIQTTLDRNIQYFTQKYLKEGVEENRASGGVAIVMDPKNGDILAWASYPDFEPYKWMNYDISIRRNKGIVEVYEPGSIFKMITVAAVLEEGLAKPNDIIYVPETLEVGGKLIKEAHKRNPGETDRRTVTEIIEKSLNVGTTVLAQRLGKEKLHKYIKKFGFGEKTEIELSGESRGLLRDVKRWSGADIGRISFGQGVAVTPIQMITGVAAIANFGELIKPRIVDKVTYNDHLSVKGSPRVSRGQIIKKETAKDVVEMMVKTVEHGTGIYSKLPGFWVAGKTGTAQKPNLQYGGYMKGEYIASFIGFFPAFDPKYIILIAIDNPKKSIYGSTVAGPVFKKIGLDLISYSNLPPERVVTKNSYINHTGNF